MTCFVSPKHKYIQFAKEKKKTDNYNYILEGLSYVILSN